LQIGIAACGRGGRGLCRSQRKEGERSQGEEENSNGSAHVIVEQLPEKSVAGGGRDSMAAG